jgi:PAS domain S-box-containing protein
MVRLGGAFWLAMMVLATSAAALAAMTWQIVSTEQQIATRRAASIEAGTILSSLTEAETGLRGYLLTNSEAFLRPYDNALPELARQRNRLTDLATRDAHGPATARVLELLDWRLSLLESHVALARSGQTSEAIEQVRTGQGQAIMVALRGTVEAMQANLAREIERISARQWWSLLVLPAVALLASLAVSLALARRAALRRLAEQAARAELSGVMANSPTGLVLIGRDRRIRDLNAAAARLAGMPREDLVGKPLSALPTLAGWEPIGGILHDVITSGRVVQDVEIELKPDRADAESRYFTGNFFPLSAGLRAQGAGIALTEITTRKQSELALAAAKRAAEIANTAKSQFLANMSHELRTPLSAVIGYSEMLEEEVADLDAPGVLSDIRKIGTNARHLLTLINDVLDLSKIEAGRMEVHAETFDAATLVREAASTVQALVARRGNRLELDCPPDLGEMSSDPVKLRQCLFNLLSNAAKFTEHGTITLKAESRGDARDWIALSVTDTGIGMSDEQLAKLFRPFTQADASTTRRFGGTGLGLSITKAFTELLGGKIEVESSPGRGSTFTLVLPRNATTRNASEKDRTVPSAGMEGVAEPGKDLVVVIDDDPHARDLLERFLRREGYSVRLAGDGRSGLDLVRRMRPAAVLLDVMMPRLDGWAVLSQLKDDPELADIPVVMVTIVRERALALSLGADDYLTKPVEWSRLRSILERCRRSSAVPRAVLICNHGDTCRVLAELVSSAGWQVIEARTVDAGAQAAASGPPPELILIDVEPNGAIGFDAPHRLKRDGLARTTIVAIAPRTLSDADRQHLDGYVAQIIERNEDWQQTLLDELNLVRATVPGSEARRDGENTAGRGP